jgi:hypothetical protein
MLHTELAFALLNCPNVSLQEFADRFELWLKRSNICVV